MRAPLSAAQIVVGRFFFVHETHVTQDDRPLQTYEFLHATFGEFLVARLVVQVLDDLVAQEIAAAHSPLSAAADDGLLHALLSFAGLTARAPVITFLGDLLGGHDEDRRAALKSLLLRLHSRALYPRLGSIYDRYEPRPLTSPSRHVGWSINLVVLAVLVAGELTGEELFPNALDCSTAWRDEATMWRSHMFGEEWAGWFETIALQRCWTGNRRDIRIWRAGPDFRPEPPDIYWTYNIPPGHPDRSGTFSWGGHNPPVLLLKSNHTCGRSDDVMMHALQPINDAFPRMANVFVSVTPTRTISATHALLATVVSGQRADRDAIYEDLARVVYALFTSPGAESADDLFFVTAAETLVSAVESGAVSVGSLAPLGDGLPLGRSSDPVLEALLTRLNALLASAEGD